jgi:Ala-tRNA(Pro) deacylase
LTSKNLKEFLNLHQVKYISMSHAPAFTAQEIADASHISGKKLAKTVIVKLDGELAMIVIPAHQQVNLIKLKEIVQAIYIELASELVMKGKFKECELGAMPPFGNLYETPVFVSKELSEGENILINAGSYTELRQVTFADFKPLVKPTMVIF